MSDTHEKETPDAIMKKIADIKARQKATTSQGEAEACIAAISRLMLRYNLSEQEIDLAEHRTKEPETAVFDEGPTDYWRKTLLTTIAYTSFTRVAFSEESRKVLIVGERHNIIATMDLYKYALETIERLVEQTQDRPRLSFGYAHQTNTYRWRNSFRMGVADGIVAKLMEQFEDDIDESDKTSALATIKGSWLDDFLERKMPNMRTETAGPNGGNPDVHPDAYSEGVTRGLFEVNLDRQLPG